MLCCSSLRQRQLGLLSHFSPLLSAAQDVARQLRLPNPVHNMFVYAPPLVVPWKDVAIHVAHKTVSLVEYLLSHAPLLLSHTHFLSSSPLDLYTLTTLCRCQLSMCCMPSTGKYYVWDTFSLTRYARLDQELLISLISTLYSRTIPNPEISRGGQNFHSPYIERFHCPLCVIIY